MDPATAAALLRIAIPLGTALVDLLKTSGRPQDAADIEKILSRSDTIAKGIIARAQAELSDPMHKG